MTVQPHVDVLAHHALLLTIPAFFPAVAVVGVVIGYTFTALYLVFGG